MLPISSRLDTSCIQAVPSFAALVATPFARGVNALCWPRALEGDFGEIVSALGDGEDVEPLDPDRLRTLSLSRSGRSARDAVLDDLERLHALDLDPELDLIHAYPRDHRGRAVSTDVYSFHVDSAPIETSTWFCTYYGPPTEGLRSADAQRRIDVSCTRAALLAEYGGNDDEGFGDFLREHAYDRHYVPSPGARPHAFAIHALWRIAVEWPGSAVPACVHRAPTTRADEKRLLLIA